MLRHALIVAALLAVPVALAEDLAVASVVVTPATATVNVGQPIQLAATAYDANGAPVNATFAWSSTQDLASFPAVDANGVFTPRNPGTARVTAAVGNTTGNATITVSDDLLVDAVILDTPFADGTYAPLSSPDVKVTATLLDGTTAGIFSGNAFFRQIVGGVAVRSTFVSFSGNGEATFTTPSTYDLPGTYVIEVQVANDGNLGTDTIAYEITL